MARVSHGCYSTLARIEAGKILTMDEENFIRLLKSTLTSKAENWISLSQELIGHLRVTQKVISSVTQTVTNNQCSSVQVDYQAQVS